MLDKIEEKNENENLMKSCFCLTPIQKNICEFCLSNSKEKEKEKEKGKGKNKEKNNINNNINNNLNNNNNVFYNKYVLDIHSQRKHYEGKIIFYFYYILTISFLISLTPCFLIYLFSYFLNYKKVFLNLLQKD